MLEINNLHVEVDGKEILKGVSLKVLPGKIHVLMGANGSGKTTLAMALMGHPRYKITNGKILLNGVDITNLAVNERAKNGLFLSFQHPSEISGVTLSSFLRSAREAVTGEKLSLMDFHKLIKEKLESLKMESSFLKRFVNEKFSGGEKKRCEMLQLSLLNPKFAILDEIDSGIDIDALKIVAKGINDQKSTGFLVITHYMNFLDLVSPDEVSIMQDGLIIEHGDKSLAKRIELEGFTK